MKNVSEIDHPLFGKSLVRFFHFSQNVIPCHCLGRLEAQDASVRIAVGVDGSADAASAVQVLTERLWPQGSEVRVITALNRRIAATAQTRDTSDAELRRVILDALGAKAIPPGSSER